jgi:non-canonical (house-cleaning) NTP pyrophosphatase
MLIAIGSTRAPKVDAAKEVCSVLKGRRLITSPGELEFLERETPSGVSAMPLSHDELMEGARNRTEFLRRMLGTEGIRADFYLGMEGGFLIVQGNEGRHCFLQNWAYVSDGERGAYGASGTIAIPESIAHEVIDGGRELAEVIDEFSNRHDVRSQEGTWGILTRDLISRKDAFKIALLNAFAPFYNPRAYL